MSFPHRESNPGHGGESAGSWPLDHMGADSIIQKFRQIISHKLMFRGRKTRMFGKTIIEHCFNCTVAMCEESGCTAELPWSGMCVVLIPFIFFLSILYSLIFHERFANLGRFGCVLRPSSAGDEMTLKRPVDLHGSKPLISLVPTTCTVSCYRVRAIVSFFTYCSPRPILDLVWKRCRSSQNL